MGLFGDNNSYGGFNQNNNQQPQQQNPEYKTKDLLYLQSLVGEESVAGRYYIKFCETLKKAGVPTSRMPTMGHFLSKMFDCVDINKLNNWLVKYAELEKIISEDDDEDSKDIINNE